PLCHPAGEAGDGASPRYGLTVRRARQCRAVRQRSVLTVAVLRACVAVLPLALAAAMPSCLLVTPLEEHASATGGSGHGGRTNVAQTGGRGGTATMVDANDEANPSTSCTTNDECIQKFGLDDPLSYRCRPSDHTCAKLKTEACPLVIGEAANPNAIF